MRQKCPLSRKFVQWVLVELYVAHVALSCSLSSAMAVLVPKGFPPGDTVRAERTAEPPRPCPALGASSTQAIAQGTLSAPGGLSVPRWDARRSPALLGHPWAVTAACHCPLGSARCPGLRLRWTLAAASGSPWLTCTGRHHPQGVLSSVTAHHGPPQSLAIVQLPSAKGNGISHSHCSVTPQRHMINTERQTFSSTDFLFSLLLHKNTPLHPSERKAALQTY